MDSTNLSCVNTVGGGAGRVEHPAMMNATPVTINVVVNTPLLLEMTVLQVFFIQGFLSVI